MMHGAQPEVAHTAIDSKDFLCSNWSMYIVKGCQKPYGSLAFTVQRNAPGLVLKWHDKAQLTVIVKGKSTVEAELLWGRCSGLWNKRRPLPLHSEAQAGWNLTRTYYFRNFFQAFVSSPGFSSRGDGCFLDAMLTSVVCDLHIERERHRERAERKKQRDREGKGKKKHNCSKWKRAENSREKSGASDRIESGRTPGWVPLHFWFFILKDDQQILQRVLTWYFY